MANEYSATWFDAFLDRIPVDWTQREVDAVSQRLPLPEFRRVLDVCCGPARHARMLSAAGYDVTGIDRDERAIARAQRAVPAGRFVQLDMRDLGTVGETFDAVLSLWQSFGYFDPATNQQVLGAMAGLLRPGGRLLLDVFHREYFETDQGTVTDVPSAACESITNTMTGARLTSEIRYVDGTLETMEFELSTPEELAERAARAGLDLVESCCWWDASRRPTPDEQRYQVVLERRRTTIGA